MMYCDLETGRFWCSGTAPQIKEFINDMEKAMGAINMIHCGAEHEKCEFAGKECFDRNTIICEANGITTTTELHESGIELWYCYNNKSEKITPVDLKEK